MRVFRIVLYAPLLALLASSPRAHAAAKEECLGCHSDPSLTAERAGKQVSLHVDAAVFSASVHKDLDCTDCHAGFNGEEIPHKKKIEAVDCASCHSDSPDKHPFHAWLSASASASLPSCKQCHGTHDIAPVRSDKFRYNPDHPVESCGSCHRDVAKAFAASAHGKALQAQEKGAPSCRPCHNPRLTRNGWCGD